ncbi:MAG: cysteine--tRNA ligase [Oscillospiraceae bacterium]|nr:cysteine--tRNA ligase [Oscillospiraceae bacterium]
MRLYNTLTLKKEEFVPVTPGHVGMYVCGPTVYSYIHIGNARPVIIFDCLRRFFEYLGQKVTFVQNFTDIDDKIINAAAAQGVLWSELTERFIAEYWYDAARLGVRSADFHPRATENIPEIIAIIKRLIENGHAYPSGGDVYYRTASFPKYGQLSHQAQEDLLAGARINPGEQKENPADFALWKAAKPGEPSWDSPWGQGRPGWHIECSAMSTKLLGDTFDIHGGGQDLAFPHHENEAAQSEGATGKKFVNYWLHNGFITVDKEKMGKSLGNFFTVRDAAGKYGYKTLRMFIVSSAYRSPLDYSENALTSAENALKRIQTAYDNAAFIAENGTDSPADAAFAAAISGYELKFREALEDDFNTANAVAVWFDAIRDGNARLADGDAAKSDAAALLALYDTLNSVLGIIYDLPEEAGGGLSDDEVNRLLEERAQARADKNFALSDELRDYLKDNGIVIEDTKQGAKWSRA